MSREKDDKRVKPGLLKSPRLHRLTFALQPAAVFQRQGNFPVHGLGCALKDFHSELVIVNQFPQDFLKYAVPDHPR